MTGTMSDGEISACSGTCWWARHTLHDKVRSEDTHGGDTDTRLGSAVGSTQAGEDDGGSAAHGTKEGLVSC